MGMGIRVCYLALLALVTLWGQGGPPGTTVRDLVVAADDPTVVFAATDAGFFISYTSGQTWVEGNGGLPSFDVQRVAGDSNVQFAALGEDGVYRSRNDEAWVFAGDGLQGSNILSVETLPSDPDILFAGSATGQIFLSLNGADGWISASVGLLEGAYFEISASPTDPDLLFASNVSLAEARGRIFRSRNRGESWQEAIAGPVTFSGVSFSLTTPGTLWIASSGGLFGSTDSGDTFEPHFVGQGQFQDVAVSPVDSQVVFATTTDGNIIRTDDGGQTWVSVAIGLPRTTITRVEVTEQYALLGLSGTGVYRSDNGGASWGISSAGMHGADVMAISVDPLTQGPVLASTAGGGMFQTRTGGSVWQESRGGLRAFQVTSMQHDPVNPSIVYGGTINPLLAGDGSLYKSLDGGVSWQAIITQVSVFDVATHPTASGTIYVGIPTDQFSGRSGLLRSSDGGDSFEEITGDFGELGFHDVIEIEVDRDDPRRVYAIVRNPFLFPPDYQLVWTEDEGRSWLGSGATTTPLSAVWVDSTNRSRVLIGTTIGMFRSTNGGASFDPANVGLPSDVAVSVSSVVSDSNDNSAVYISTSAGVFKSEDRGDSWVAADSGLEPFLVRQLVVDPSAAGQLYAGTLVAGVFKTVDGGANWVATGGLAELSSLGVVNAASFQPGGIAIAPGEIVSLFVQNAGPEVGVSATAFDPETGKLPTTLAGVRVFFGDTAAPLFFVRRDQLNVQAPFEIAGLDLVGVRVEYEGASSGVIPVKVRPSDPGLFAPVLNQDSTVNTEANAAARGSVVQFFATGQGSVTPAVMTGAPGGVPLSFADLEVKAFVNGQEATVLFAGLTPGLVGLLQVNVQLPVGFTGPVTIQLEIGGIESASTTTVFVL